MARTSPRRSGLPVESMVDALGHRSALRLAMAFGGKSIDLSTAGGKATEEMKAAIGEDGLASLRTACGTRSAKVPMPDIVVLFIMEDELSPIDRLTMSRRWGGSRVLSWPAMITWPREGSMKPATVRRIRPLS